MRLAHTVTSAAVLRPAESSGATTSGGVPGRRLVTVEPFIASPTKRAGGTWRPSVHGYPRRPWSDLPNRFCGWTPTPAR
jgi:hypothetical protein